MSSENGSSTASTPSTNGPSGTSTEVPATPGRPGGTGSTASSSAAPWRIDKACIMVSSCWCSWLSTIAYTNSSARAEPSEGSASSLSKTRPRTS
ncbi:Uncharacterised protein [Mycobacteroides abscessus subsp. abscessus]|nr:Uncharacterised protein [Mycobacteroides abscessus subsp. abscessus]